MLTEFAFTPAVFDQEAHEDKADWRVQLKEILRALAPRTGVSAVIVADLYAGVWSQDVLTLLKEVDDPKLKQVCQDIISVLPSRLVHRDVAADFPESDLGWCNEALASHVVEPIERIVSISKTKESVENPIVRTLEELEDGGFWSGIDSVASPDPILSAQIPKLRTLCLHSEWLGYCNPYGATSEVNFTIEFLKSALNLPSQFSNLKIEAHFAKSDVDVNELQRLQSRCANYLRNEVGAPAGTHLSCNVFFWSKLLERSIVGGVYTEDGKGNVRKKPKWGVSMTHVARNDAAGGENHKWRLLDRREIAEPFNNVLDDGLSSRPTFDTAF